MFVVRIRLYTSTRLPSGASLADYERAPEIKSGTKFEGRQTSAVAEQAKLPTKMRAFVTKFSALYEHSSTHPKSTEPEYLRHFSVHLFKNSEQACLRSVLQLFPHRPLSPVPLLRITSRMSP